MEKINMTTTTMGGYSIGDEVEIVLNHDEFEGEVGVVTGFNEDHGWRLYVMIDGVTLEVDPDDIDHASTEAPLVIQTRDVKMMRETLCVAQSAILHSPTNGGASRESHVNLIQVLINECDRHRPLGPNGKHGTRHTATCGCEDKY